MRQKQAKNKEAKMPRIYSPGASVSDDYAHICDRCGVEGKATMGWTLEDGRYFDLCIDCLSEACLKFTGIKHEEATLIKRAYISEQLRNEIFQRDGYKCLLCGRTDELTIDHIIPFVLGGETKKSNLQTLCRNCNSQKGKRVLRVARC